MTATSPRTSAQSPLQAVDLASVGVEALDWLGAVCHAIERLHESGGGTIHIKYLASLGRYVACDIGETLASERDHLVGEATV